MTQIKQSRFFGSEKDYSYYTFGPGSIVSVYGQVRLPAGEQEPHISVLKKTVWILLGSGVVGTA